MNIYWNHNTINLEVNPIQAKINPPISPILLFDSVKTNQTQQIFHVFFANETEKMQYFELLKSNFLYLEAAGGIVQNESKNFLAMFRRGSWDLPKGKIDKGELPLTAALREIEEETGLKMLVVQEIITSSYHVYEQKGQFLLKRTYWYHVLAKGDLTLTPQKEEDIEKCEWFTWDQLNNLDTFGSIKEVIDIFGKGKDSKFRV